MIDFQSFAVFLLNRFMERSYICMFFFFAV